MKYNNGCLGGIENLGILMREECDLFHYSDEPELTRISYKFCPLKKGASINPTAGFVIIDEINETEDDVQVILEYCSCGHDPKKAFVSLGQEIKFYMVDWDETPDKYLVSNCYLSIASKEFAKQTIDEHNKDKNKQIIRRK